MWPLLSAGPQCEPPRHSHPNYPEWKDILSWRCDKTNWFFNVSLLAEKILQWNIWACSYCYKSLGNTHACPWQHDAWLGLTGTAVVQFIFWKLSRSTSLNVTPEFLASFQPCSWCQRQLVDTTVETRLKGHAEFDFLLTSEGLWRDICSAGLSRIPYLCKCLLEQCCHPEMEP